MKNSYRILVLSDSHGKREYLNTLVNNQVFDYIFYLGDGTDRDLSNNIYNPSFLFVKGNCDDYFSDYPISQIVHINNHKVLLTHGHEFKVKYGKELLFDFANKNNISIVCFGHTHKQIFENIHGIFFINPGALKNGDYAEIDINNNAVKVCFKNILS